MKPSASSHGFSLVEVVIALGIATFALTTILAMMPIGLSTLRDAMDDTMESRMIRKISADLQMTPFSQIESGNVFFDAEGEAVSQADDARYRVQISSHDHGTAHFPGAQTGIESDLISLGVTIFRVTPSGDVSVRTFPIAISRSETRSGL